MTASPQPGFTIISNYLAQHPGLSMTAIGLATYIQMLPGGAPVDIDTLDHRFTEGRDEIAAAMDELEAEGYIERVPVRLPDGRTAVRTHSYNNPAAARADFVREAGTLRTAGAVQKAGSVQKASPDYSEPGQASR
ncbi:hypothetical protein [Streptomyces sp. NBC_00344]|uniref:hypothetical protein n=1 Tax=Streptomyces sp. NBC_00344 TaxID=2975720 RepID=UPI002E2446A0